MRQFEGKTYAQMSGRERNWLWWQIREDLRQMIEKFGKRPQIEWTYTTTYGPDAPELNGPVDDRVKVYRYPYGDQKAN